MAKVVVLGGGVAGLAASHYIRTLLPSSAVASVCLIEGSLRLGGWMQSVQHDSGVLLEAGPRTLRAAGTAGANTLVLAHDLGLEGKIRSVSYGHPTTMNRMIKVNGALHRLPSSLSTALKKTPPFTKPLLVALLQDLRSEKVCNCDESLYSFVNRRFGREVATYVIDPLARGVFAGNARELSVKSLAKSLHAYEQRHGSVIKGACFDVFTQRSRDSVLTHPMVKKARKEKWAVWSLQEGIETLIKALERDVVDRGVDIRLGHPVNKLSQNGRCLKISFGSNEISADHVISCLPCSQAASVCGNLSKDLAQLLNAIPFATVAVVNLAYDRSDLVTQPAFGYLVPSCEPSKVLGVIFDTCTFPQANKTVLTVMMGGYWFNSLFGTHPSEEKLLSTAIDELRSTLGISDHPSAWRTQVLRACIPQYVVGHTEVVASARRLIDQHKLPVSLAGNSYDGVGVNDAILSAKAAVQNLATTLGIKL
ncbi:protoporphyrinogen oxidase-like [Hyalella azteca]|uniref:Protoporphyrinogen oxidase n=1 Tax=Hyalella azteca TaxID=294128 RepID=A0A8B7NTB1_HYAAZ|nr:protoporphyrinogen oxidase-like [Hyalella azteca]